MKDSCGFFSLGPYSALEAAGPKPMAIPPQLEVDTQTEDETRDETAVITSPSGRDTSAAMSQDSSVVVSPKNTDLKSVDTRTTNQNHSETASMTTGGQLTANDDAQQMATTPITAIRSPTGANVSAHNVSKLERIDETAAEAAMKFPTEVVFEKELHKELDFDVNPSELYLMLQRRDWIGATQHLKRNPEEATYWISRKELDGKLRWRLLPIHGAIIFSAPDTMIQSLVDAYPASVSSKDDQGMLPLHLSYRMGSPASVVEVLLNAFPESVDVKDRKGRTALIMAQTSKGPNRAEFLKTIERKASGQVSPMASATSTSKAEAAAGQRAIFEAQIKDLKKEHKEEMQATIAESKKIQSDLEKQIIKLKGELKLTEETSSVLVTHVASLEKKQKQSDETETALATRIATLDNSFKATLKEKQALEKLLTTERDGLKKKVEEIEGMLVTAHEDYKKLKDRMSVTKLMADKEKKEMEEKFKGRTKEYGALKKDYVGVCNNVTILEAQLRNKILHEQKLVKQVSSLARQLSTATEDNDNATRAFTERLHSLTHERDDLRSTIKMLCKKLFAVALFLGDMENEQSEIFEKAVTRGKEMEVAAEKHKELVEEVRAQKLYFQEAKDQRALLMELMRQQETALQRANEDRERIVAAIEDHAKHVESNVHIRQELVEDAGSLKHQISDILGSVKLFIPKGTQDDEEMVDEVIRTVLSHQDDDVLLSSNGKSSSSIMGEYILDDQEQPKTEEHEEVSSDEEEAEAENVQDPAPAEDSHLNEETAAAEPACEKEEIADEMKFKMEDKEEDMLDEPPLPITEDKEASDEPEAEFETKVDEIVQEDKVEEMMKATETQELDTEEPIQLDQYMEESTDLKSDADQIVEALLAERAEAEKEEEGKGDEHQLQQKEEDGEVAAAGVDSQLATTFSPKHSSMVEIHIDIQHDDPEEIELPVRVEAPIRVDYGDVEERDEAAESPKESAAAQAATSLLPMQQSTEQAAEVDVAKWKDVESPCEMELEKWNKLMEG